VDATQSLVQGAAWDSLPQGASENRLARVRV
jgi:hypothetical protein